MSITYELREWMKGSTLSSWTAEHLTAIANRIDAEHKKALNSVDDALNSVDDAYDSGYNVGYDEGFASADDWLGQHEDAMAEHGWIRMPLDADGEYIRIGDVMEWVRYEDDDPTIVRNVAAVGADVFFAWSDEQGRYAQYEAHAYRHHHAPTVEDVLTEFGIDWEYEDNCEDRAALLKEYAKRLTLAGDAK